MTISFLSSSILLRSPSFQFLTHQNNEGGTGPCNGMTSCIFVWPNCSDFSVEDALWRPVSSWINSLFIAYRSQHEPVFSTHQFKKARVLKNYTIPNSERFFLKKRHFIGRSTTTDFEPHNLEKGVHKRASEKIQEKTLWAECLSGHFIQ